METRHENTAAMDVTSQIVLAGTQPIFPHDRLKAEQTYRVAHIVLNDMVAEGLISREDIAVIDTILRSKIDPISCTIL